MDIKLGRKSKTFLKIIISLSLLSYIIYSSGPYKILDQFRHINVSYFLLAFVISTVGVVLSAKKWQILLKAKSEKIGFAKVLKIYYIGHFFNLFLPTTIGGDAVKAYKMSKESKKKVEAYSSVFMERFTGLIAVLILVLISTTIYFYELPLNILLVVYVIFTPLVLIGTLFLLKKKWLKKFRGLYNKIFNVFNPFSIKEKIEKVYDSLNLYKSKKKFLFYSIVISIVFQTLLILTNYILAISIGIGIPLRFFFIFIPICVVLLFLPISIRGFGVREVLYVYFFTQVGASSAEAVSMSFLFQIMGIISSSIGGFVYMIWNQ